MKKAQQHGAKKTPVIWKHINDLNMDLSRKTAKGILDFAILYHADVIVFEYPGIKGYRKAVPLRSERQL